MLYIVLALTHRFWDGRGKPAISIICWTVHLFVATIILLLTSLCYSLTACSCDFICQYLILSYCAVCYLDPHFACNSLFCFVFSLYSKVISQINNGCGNLIGFTHLLYFVLSQNWNTRKDNNSCRRVVSGLVVHSLH